MRKLSLLLVTSALYLSSFGSVLAAPRLVATPKPTLVPTPFPTAIPTPTPVPGLLSSSAQNTLFFIVVAVLLVAIIWYILGMPDEDMDEDSKAAPVTPAPKPKRSSRKK